MKELKQYDPTAKAAEIEAISDDELDTVSGGLYEDYDTKKYIKCPVCFRLVLKTPAAFNEHNYNSGCHYDL